MNLRYLSSLFLLLFWLSGCHESEALRPTKVPENRQPTAAQQNSQNTNRVEDIFTSDPLLSYQGYTVTKFQKTVDVEGIKTEVSYAVLRKGATTVATFDRLHHPAGNSTQFGLFPFVSGQPKQLVVEQSSPRNWSHWVIQLVPDFKVIFDSGKWSVDGELTPVDVDRDGTFEFTKTLTILYDFRKLPTSASPLIPVLFRYDLNAKEYIPANQLFPEYALKGIEDKLTSLDRNNAQTHLAGVLHVLMRYIYAGKRDEGWAIYEKEYKLADKDLVKAEILGNLASEPVYKFIYAG